MTWRCYKRYWLCDDYIETYNNHTYVRRYIFTGNFEELFILFRYLLLNDTFSLRNTLFLNVFKEYVIECKILKQITHYDDLSNSIFVKHLFAFLSPIVDSPSIQSNDRKVSRSVRPSRWDRLMYTLRGYTLR